MTTETISRSVAFTSMEAVVQVRMVEGPTFGWETVAAFDIFEAAAHYAKDCEKDARRSLYRVLRVVK